MPRFIRKRDWRLVTTNSLEFAVNTNDALDSIFYSQDPEYIAFTINNELNNIINSLAPPKIYQSRKEWTPYIVPELRVKINLNNKLLTRAISGRRVEDWLEHRRNRLSINIELEAARAQYLSSKIDNTSERWKTFRQVSGKNVFITPKSIVNNGKMERRPGVLADLANRYYINKIKTIRENLAGEKRDPMAFTKALIPRNTEEFVVPMVSIAQVRHLIRNLKSSGSTGYDDLSSKTLKKLAGVICPHIMHMINTILRTSTFPQCFKITKIIPILKPGKPAELIDSYRPINCLPTLEKLLEGWILQALNE